MLAIAILSILLLGGLAAAMGGMMSMCAIRPPPRLRQRGRP